MNALVVFCHPVPDSFGAAVRDAILGTVPDTRQIDLYAGHELPRGFDGSDAAALRWAEAVVLVYPTWWSSFPAPLMAWVEAGLEVGGWSHLQRVVAVTTHGSSRLVNMLTGGIGRRVVRRGLPTQMADGAHGRFIALYEMDRIDDDERLRFLERVPDRVRTALD